MSNLTAQQLADALHAYMNDFEIYQEDFSKVDEDTGELDTKSPRLVNHVLIGDEIPSMPGFSVKVQTPIRKLQALYNGNKGTDCPWVNAVEIFKAFMESRIATAAAFKLIDSSFAKDMMKQWVNWRTDVVVLEDTRKELSPTEAGARISSVLKELIDNAPPPPAKKDNAVIEDAVIIEDKNEALAKAISRKRRNG